jgi:hypothetical protein
LNNNKIKYDSSFLDIDFISPRENISGSLTYFPFYYKDILIFPVNIPFDSLLMKNIKLKKIYNYYVKKIEKIKKVGGVVVINTHPNIAYSGSKRVLKIYFKLLTYLYQDKDLFKLDSFNSFKKIIADVT